MKTRRLFIPYLLLVLLWAVFAVYVCLTSQRLPEVVAVHFGANGLPNNWETVGSYIRFTLIFGAAVPAFILGIFSLIRFCGPSLMNLPHKEYWLAPERRAETFAYVQRQSVWMAALLIAFFAGVHYFILSANAHHPVILAPALVWWISGGILAMAIVWVAAFIRHFFRKPV
jgi:serine/threonine-protein kinase